MLRWIDQSILTVLVVLSLALLVLWFRSQTVGDRYRWIQLTEDPNGAVLLETESIMIGEGGIGITRERRLATEPDVVERLRRYSRRVQYFQPAGYSRIDDPRYPVRGGSADSVWSILGFYSSTEQRAESPNPWIISNMTIPLWLPLVIVFTYPLIRFMRGIVRRERMERVVMGLCPRCGIDVRNSPDRCPVCGKKSPLVGAPVAAAAAAR